MAPKPPSASAQLRPMHKPPLASAGIYWAGKDSPRWAHGCRRQYHRQPTSMEKMLETLGKEVDCFVTPCDSFTWKENYNILVLKEGECCIAVPRKHRLAKKEKLQWSDLDGEMLMLLKRGDSPELNRLRDEIETKHPNVGILDIPHFYDTSIFNECEQTGCIMETLDIWKDVHPSIVTIPVEWDYKTYYGIVYAKSPSKVVRDFIKVVQQNIKI